MPTSVIGVAFYVFALFPGIAFIFAREGHQPAAKRSVLRETAALVFVSAVCDAVVALLIAVLANCWPWLHRQIEHLFAGDLGWPREHLISSVLALIVVSGAATILGYGLGTKWAHEHGLKLLWKSAIPRDTSAWKQVMDSPLEVILGIVLKSGGFVTGAMYAFDDNPDPHPNRAVTLTDPKYRAPGAGDDELVEMGDYLVVEAGEIEVLQVIHRLPDGAVTEESRPRRWPFNRRMTIQLAAVFAICLLMEAAIFLIVRR